MAGEDRPSLTVGREHVLGQSFMPPKTPHRREQLVVLRACLLHASSAHFPVYVYGVPGTGKTITLKHVFPELSRRDKPEPIHMND